MATFQDLEMDWSALCQDCPECWSDSDLQLAAELGKTLLERNKELETSLKQHQNVIEDQAQEIEYLTKQTVALREVNDSRLRIYEQLEVSIQDLERANHRLALDHTADKKHIKSLIGTVEGLETKCEDLQKNVEELSRLLELQKRRAERQSEQQERLQKSEVTSTTTTILPSKCQSESSPPMLREKDFSHEVETACEEELIRINKELGESRILQMKEQRRITELEEQLASMVQENNRLQEKMRDWNQNEDAMKSMHEEFSILEEVRQGQLCGRCLRSVEQGGDDMSSIMDAEEDDDRSVMSSLANEPRSLVPHKLVNLQDPRGVSSVQAWATPGCLVDNPYRDLVEKYEALLEVQRHQANNVRSKPKAQNTSISTLNTSAPLSLQEELQMSGDFSQFSIKDTDEESGHGDDTNKSTNVQTKTNKCASNRKNFIRTPDFSEAETSSSGFSDETSNKATQTDRERPGSFLCTIADGEDCRFSIYDDASPIDSRFRNRPEYRELFKEIFTILKKAAENKDEGEKLPLLDDTVPVKCPPVTPANEDMPGDFTDETQSIMSSVMSEQSVAFSDITPPENVQTEKENVTKITDALKVLQEKGKEEPKPIAEPSGEAPKVLTPLVRQPLDYMAASPQFRKKSSRNKNRKHSQDRQGAESPVIPSPPKICYQRGAGSKRRRDYRPLDVSPLVKSSKPAPPAPEWNGSSMQFFNRALNSPTPSQNGGKVTAYQRWNPETDSWDVKQSTASQDLHKLRRLELSYAEVLRNADKNKGRRRKHQ